jgi:hypothetical protein
MNYEQGYSWCNDWIINIKDKILRIYHWLQNRVYRIYSWFVGKINGIYYWYKAKWVEIWGIIFLLSLIVGLILLVIYVKKNYTEADADNIIHLLQILLSWPTLGALICVIFISKFSEAIREFLITHSLGDHLGPVSLQDKQVDKVNLEGKAESETEDRLRKIEGEIKQKDENIENWKKLYETQNQIIEIHEFKYLSLALVNMTKIVLNWFNNLKDSGLQITQEYFNDSWKVTIPDSNERMAIFNALWQNGLIQSTLETPFSITPKGERFLKFIRPVKWE